MKDAAVAFLVAFAMSQGLTRKIRTLLLKQSLAVSGEAHKDSVLRAMLVETSPVLSSRDIASSLVTRYSMHQLFAAVGKKG